MPVDLADPPLHVSILPSSCRVCMAAIGWMSGFLRLVSLLQCTLKCLLCLSQLGVNSSLIACGRATATALLHAHASQPWAFTLVALLAGVAPVGAAQVGWLALGDLQSKQQADAYAILCLSHTEQALKW